MLVHARALLTSVPEGETAYLDADLRDPGQILDRAAQTLNFAQPVALMLVAVLHFLPDLEQAYAIVRRLSGVLAPGSLLVLSHGSYDLVPAENARLLTESPYPGSGDFFPRTREQIGGFFHGWDLLTPGATGPGTPGVPCLISQWGPLLRGDGEVLPDPGDVSMWGGVAVKLDPAGASGVADG